MNKFSATTHGVVKPIHKETRDDAEEKKKRQNRKK